MDAHIRRVSPEHLGGMKMLRRGYNFTDGSDGFGHLDAGLFFIAFVRNPATNFIPVLAADVQRRAQRIHHPHRHSGIRLSAGAGRARLRGLLGLHAVRLSGVTGLPASALATRLR